MWEQARSAGKRALARTPRLRAIGKAVFVLAREATDVAVTRLCHPRVETVWLSRAARRELTAAGYHSQYGQDAYIFRLLGSRPHGYFVDIGANDPRELSNSYYLEQQGWDGLAIDPLAQMAPRWASERRATFVRVAIGERDKAMDFVEFTPREGWEHTLSGFADAVRPADLRALDHRVYEVRVRPLSAVVPQGVEVDLLLIDVEGAELEVVQGIDLDVLRPSVVVIENVGRVGGTPAVRSLLRAAGYRLTARIGAADDVFIPKGARRPTRARIVRTASAVLETRSAFGSAPARS